MAVGFEHSGNDQRGNHAQSNAEGDACRCFFTRTAEPREHLPEPFPESQGDGSIAGTFPSGQSPALASSECSYNHGTANGLSRVPKAGEPDPRACRETQTARVRRRRSVSCQFGSECRAASRGSKSSINERFDSRISFSSEPLARDGGEPPGAEDSVVARQRPPSNDRVGDD